TAKITRFKPKCRSKKIDACSSSSFVLENLGLRLDELTAQNSCRKVSLISQRKSPVFRGRARGRFGCGYAALRTPASASSVLKLGLAQRYAKARKALG